MRTEKTLIRRGGCPAWFEPPLGAQVILLVLSCCGSFSYFGIHWPSLSMLRKKKGFYRPKEGETKIFLRVAPENYFHGTEFLQIISSFYNFRTSKFWSETSFEGIKFEQISASVWKNLYLSTWALINSANFWSVCQVLSILQLCLRYIHYR